MAVACLERPGQRPRLKKNPHRWLAGRDQDSGQNMNVGIVGGGINGLCCAWLLQQQGHAVRLYERDRLLSATSSCSSKLLHDGLR